MLPILDGVVGSMAGSISSGLALSDTAGTLTTEGTEDTTGEGMGAVKMRQNAFPLHTQCSSTICTLWTTFLGYNII